MIWRQRKTQMSVGFWTSEFACLEKPMLVIFSVVVWFYFCCLVLLIVTWNNDSYWFFLKFTDDLHIKQTLKYEIHNIVTSIWDKNYFVAFDSTRSLLFSDISFRLVPIKTLAGQVLLYQYVTLTEYMHTHSFLAICSTLVSLWLILLWFSLVCRLQMSDVVPYLGEAIQ